MKKTVISPRFSGFAPALMLCLLGFSSALAVAPARADTLLIERVQKERTMDMPRRGSTMEQVRQRYGEPQTVKGPVGQPPITTWVYPRFTCYFEHQWVIDCVANKVSPLEKGPRPVR